MLENFLENYIYMTAILILTRINLIKKKEFATLILLFKIET